MTNQSIFIEFGGGGGRAFLSVTYFENLKAYYNISNKTDLESYQLVYLF